MAWNPPATFVVNEIVTAAKLNQIRESLIDLDRRTSSVAAFVDAVQSSSSTSFVDLATAGPAVTAMIGSTGVAVVDTYVSMANTANTGAVLTSFAVSGASSVPAVDGHAMAYSPPSAGVGDRRSNSYWQRGLTAGANTFVAKYRVVAGTGSWANRRLTVTPQGA